MIRLITSCLTLALLAPLALAAEHIVKMKNMGADGSMVFEPGFLKVAVGDTVHFEPADAAHNSESIPGLTPPGAVTWKGGMNQKVSVTLDKEGAYVYQCMPHAVMGMVGVVVAGNPTNLTEVQTQAKAVSSKFVMNKERLDQYLSDAKVAASGE